MASLEDLVASMPTSFMAGEMNERAAFMARFCAVDRAHSKAFRGAFQSFLSHQGFDAKSVALREVFEGFLCYFLLGCLEYGNVCLISTPIVGLGISAAAQMFSRKIIRIVDTRTDKDDIKRLEEIVNQSESQPIQLIVSFDKWTHEVLLSDRLSNTIAANSLLCTVAYGDKVVPVRSGKMTRGRYALLASSITELSEPGASAQLFASLAIFRSK